MWLLDTKTITLHLILSSPPPPYAILSHTWGTQVTLQDLQCTPPRNQHLAGYKKILDCCAQARLDGFDWVWIDTCCIDKTNSAELSEAINSMFEWYRNAVQCYAYLADAETVEEFVKSRWFTRGWTLQELLAPLSVIFFNKNWEEIGTKASLAGEISTITGIPRVVLLTNSDKEFSVAQIMSWAAKRETTREEDIAYSLLGLFDVNMPMIYGEGRKAFQRLQLEIMKASEDHSIFAWSANVLHEHERGPLAISPAEFEFSGKVQYIAAEKNTAEYSMTNRGLRIKFNLAGPYEYSGLLGEPDGTMFAASLDCQLADGRALGIFLRQKRPGQYVRTLCARLIVGKEELPKKGKTKLQELYFTNPGSSTFNISQWMRMRQGLYVFDVIYSSVLKHGYVLQEQDCTTSSSFSSWSVKKKNYELELTFSIYGSDNEGEFVFKHTEREERFVVTLGIFNHQVWSDIMTTSPPDTTKYWLEPDVVEEFKKRVDAPTRRNVGRWKGLDRVSCELGNNLRAAVKIKNTVVDGKKHFLVGITISPTMR
ncbi:HET-domain-containing protein [Stipitochalara longipes BDJ]|nr:HET-domain-containing protein [Stipitochalara longipes BDJ]